MSNFNQKINMSKQILTILFLLTTNLISGQLTSIVDNVKIKLGAKQKFEAYPHFVGADETGCYMLRKHVSGSDFIKYPKYWLEHFNKDANPTKLVQLEIREKGEKHRLEEVLMLDGQLFVITFLKNKKAKEVNFFAQSINKKDFSINPQRKKIYTIDNSEHEYEKVKFNYCLSPDQKSLLIYSTDFRKVIHNKAYDFKVFNQQMDLVYEKSEGDMTTTFHYQNTLNDLILDNNQNIYVLTSNVVKEVKKKFFEKYIEETISSKARIIRFKNGGQQIDSVSLDFEDYKLANGQLLINDDGTFSCLGSLTKTKRNLISSTFYCSVDFDKSAVVPIKYNAFDQKLLLGTHLDEDHKEQKRNLRIYGECLLKNYLNLDVVKSNKGDFYLINEKVETLESTTTSGEEGFLGGGQMKKTTAFRFFKALVITKYSKDGDFIWTTKVPKNTTLKNTSKETETYAVKAIDDNFYLFFGDTKKRVGYKRDINLPKSTSKHFVALIKIDETGNYQRKSIMNSKKKVQLFGFGQLALDERELILQVSTFKTRQLVRLRID